MPGGVPLSPASRCLLPVLLRPPARWARGTLSVCVATAGARQAPKPPLERQVLGASGARGPESWVLGTQGQDRGTRGPLLPSPVLLAHPRLPRPWLVEGASGTLLRRRRAGRRPRAASPQSRSQGGHGWAGLSPSLKGRSGELYTVSLHPKSSEVRVSRRFYVSLL